MKYYANIQNGLIYCAVDNIILSTINPSTGTLGDTAFEGDNVREIINRSKQNCGKSLFRPINKKVVFFLSKEGGYNPEYFKSER